MSNVSQIFMTNTTEAALLQVLTSARRPHPLKASMVQCQLNILHIKPPFLETITVIPNRYKALILHSQFTAPVKSDLPMGRHVL